MITRCQGGYDVGGRGHRPRRKTFTGARKAITLKAAKNDGAKFKLPLLLLALLSRQVER